MKEAVKLHMVCISSSNDRHPFPKTFTPLHYTFRHFTSSHLNFTHLHFTTLHSTSLQLSTLDFLPFKLHPTTLYYPLIWLNPSKFPTAPFHLTSLNFTSLYVTPLLHDFSPHFCSFHSTPFIIAFLTLFLKLLGLQGKSLTLLQVVCYSYLWFYLQGNTSRYPFSSSCPQFSEHDQPCSNSKVFATCRV